MASNRVTRPWTKQEDSVLRDAISRFNQTSTIDWHKVASDLPRRNNKECRKRWVYSLESRISKGPWSSDEDELLKKGVTKYGLKWAAVAEVVTTRQPDQCSRRWHEVVNPLISHERWSLLEDEILKEAVDTYGRKWTEIVERFFPNRTPISARNRFKQRFESRTSNASDRQSSISSEDQKTSSLLWTIHDHTQQGPSSYEHSPIYNQMQPASACGQWSTASSAHGSVSPHPASIHDFNFMPESSFTHSRNMSQPSDVTPHHRSVNSFGSAFAMEDLMPDGDNSSAFGSPHGYPSPLTSGSTVSGTCPVRPPHFEAYSYTQPAEPAITATGVPSHPMVLDNTDSYMTSHLHEMNYTGEEQRRLMNARAQMAQMRQASASSGSQHSRAAPNLQTLAY